MKLKSSTKYILIIIIFLIFVAAGIYLVIDLFQNEPIIFSSPAIETNDNYSNEHWLQLDSLVDSVKVVP